MSMVQKPIKTDNSIYSAGSLAGVAGREIVRAVAAKGIEELVPIVKNYVDSLGILSSHPESEVDQSMRVLQITVCAAAERARKLSLWNLEEVEKNASERVCSRCY